MRPALIWAMLLTGVLGIAALSFVATRVQPSPVSTPINLRPPTPTAGNMQPMDGRIDVLDANGYAMAKDEPTATNIADWVKRGGFDQINALVESGDAYFLANGTHVRLLEIDAPLTRIQVMDGPHRNRSGWLPVNATSR